MGIFFQGTIYVQSATAVPFRRCDNKNLGISTLCNLNDVNLPQPPIFGRQMIVEFEEKHGAVPSCVSNKFRDLDDERKFSAGGEVFSQQETVVYDAYEKDIATVSFFFETPTVFQFYRQSRMGPIEFMSQVGGLLGLCVGFSLCSGIEIIYWFLCRFWFRVKKKKN